MKQALIVQHSFRSVVSKHPVLFLHVCSSLLNWCLSRNCCTVGGVELESLLFDLNLTEKMAVQVRAQNSLVAGGDECLLWQVELLWKVRKE